MLLLSLDAAFYINYVQESLLTKLLSNTELIFKITFSVIDDKTSVPCRKRNRIWHPPLKNNQYDDNIPTTSIYEMYTCCWFVVNKFKGLKDIKFYSKAEKYFSQDIKWCTLFKLVKENCMKCFK